MLNSELSLFSFTMAVKNKYVPGWGSVQSSKPQTYGLDSCGTCNLCQFHLNNSSSFNSSVTGKSFNMNIPLNDLACKCRNVIYLITCKKCSIQYVGMTTQTLRDRFYQHRHAIKKNTLNTLIVLHFNRFNHSADDLSIQVIYQFQSNKNLECVSKILQDVEEYYMSILSSVYPFGLNDHVASLKCNLKHCDISTFFDTFTPYFNLSKYSTFEEHGRSTNLPQRRKRNHGHRKCKRIKHTLNIEEAVNDYILRLYDLFVNVKLRELYVTLRSVSRTFILKCLYSNNTNLNNDVRLVLLAFYSQYKKNPHQKKTTTMYLTIPYIHKTIENINLNGLMNESEVRSFLPNSAKKFKICVSYSYGPPIGGKLFNYNKTLKEITPQNLSQYFVCDCLEKYKDFIYKPHGHVHTGDLEIISNTNLRNIMKKGAKFREVPVFSKRKLLAAIHQGIDSFAVKLALRCDRPMASFERWLNIIHKKVDEKCKYLNYKHSFANQVTNNPEVKKYIAELQSRFVIVPVDKAANNFAIICKSFYIQTLCNELGVIDKKVQGNSVYKPSDKSTSQVFDMHRSTLKQFNIRLTTENCHIPFLYWTSKQHKSPYKFRFIAGARKCTTKQISAEVGLVLSCLKTHFKNYCNKIKKYSGIAHFWSVDSSVEVLNKINKLPAKSIETFDFSTLYTNLPLNTIYESLKKLIIKMYNNSNSHTILVNVSKKKAFWYTGTYYSGYKKYTVDKIIEALHFVLFNTYVQFGGYVFEQKTGIPMGGNASPLIADLYLAWCEYTYISEIKKTDVQLAKILSNNSRYIDDILVLNFTDFGNIAKCIYAEELILKKKQFIHNSGHIFRFAYQSHKWRF